MYSDVLFLTVIVSVLERNKTFAMFGNSNFEENTLCATAAKLLFSKF